MARLCKSFSEGFGPGDHVKVTIEIEIEGTIDRFEGGSLFLQAIVSTYEIEERIIQKVERQ